MHPLAKASICIYICFSDKTAENIVCVYKAWLKKKPIRGLHGAWGNKEHKESNGKLPRKGKPHKNDGM